MPYLASPPEPPPLVQPVPPTAPDQLESAASSGLTRSAARSLSQPSAPESFLPESSPASSIATTQATGAASLGEPLSAGYGVSTPVRSAQPNPTSAPASSSQGHSAAATPESTVPPASRVRSQPSLQPRAPRPTPATASAPLTYELAGVDRTVSATQQEQWVSTLNQAMIFMGLQSDLNALEGYVAQRVRQPAAIAQAQPTKPKVPSPAAGTTEVPTDADPAEDFPDQLPPLEPIPPLTIPTPEAPPSSLPGADAIPSTPSTSPSPEATPTPSASPAPNSPIPGSSPPAAGAAPLPAPPGTVGVVELTADYQTYDEQRRIFTAEGNVVMRFQGAVLDADRLQVNLLNRNAVAEGNVALRRGNQVLRGRRFAYNFVQGIGRVEQASGDIYLPSVNTDANPPLASDLSTGTVLDRPLSDRAIANQPTQNVQSTGDVTTAIGIGRDASRVPGATASGGQIRRLRFEAEQIDFTPEGWEARNIEITNDPFSPPELVLKADRAKLTRIGPLQDEVRATRPRLVFDQRVTIPLLVSRTVLDRRQRQPGLVQIGFDNGERGGLFLERSFEPILTDRVRLTLTPQFFLQQAVTGKEDGVFDPANFGLRAGLDVDLGPRTQIQGNAVFTSLDLNDVDSKLRASLRGTQFIGDHRLALEYSYRDRLFNGSLGFQTVQSSLGAVLTSPNILLGRSGINLSYQVGFQNISADTDRLDLLAPIRENNRINLSRFQTVAALSRGFSLWQGKSLPPTPTEGLRYTPVPVTPYISLVTGLTGIFSAYTSGDTQQNLVGSVGLIGQFGNFSKDFLDYTAFNISYTQYIGSGQSPFLFDRSVDNRILNAGFVQQIYGPFRFGIQTSYNLDTNESISTDYILEYSRRTYGITLRYNPVLSLGFIGFRVSDFNWTGGATPFYGSGVTPVEGGIRRFR